MTHHAVILGIAGLGFASVIYAAARIRPCGAATMSLLAVPGGAFRLLLVIFLRGVL